MSIIHIENNHRKINKLEESKILKASSSKYLLIDDITGKNDPIYKFLPTSVSQATNKVLKTNNNNNQ